MTTPAKPTADIPTVAAVVSESDEQTVAHLKEARLKLKTELANS